MAKIDHVIDQGGSERAIFSCPGCGFLHQVHVKRPDGQHPIWEWNGSVDAPTFYPSILVTWNEGREQAPKTCHSYVTDGRIQFLGDCTHALAGRTVELPEAYS